MLSTTVLGAPLPGRPLVDDLQRAYARHDAVELERVGTRFGGYALVGLVEKGDARRAALGALELIDGWGALPFVPRLVAIADHADDPALAIATMETVRRVAERVPRGELDLEELPVDVPRSACDALVALAGKETSPAPLRVDAAYALAALAPLVPSAPSKVAALTTTSNVEVRRALADALPPTATDALVKLVSVDGNASVAAAAAGSLCRDVPPPGAERKNDKSLKRSFELPTAAHARFRALVVDTTLPELDRVDIVPCLRAGAQHVDEKAVDAEVLHALAKGPDEALKRRARSYGGR